MHPIETALFDYMVNNGVDRDTAFTASQNCARAVRNGALSGFVVGFTVGIETMNPSALLMGGVGAAGGAGVALAISPSCSEVRNAANNWANNSLGF